MAEAMSQVTSGNLMDILLSIKTSSDVEQLIKKLGNTIQWVPFGNNSGNYGIISMSCDPYDGITERITNSIDAMIELGVELNSNLKDVASPRKAVEYMYNIPDGNLRYATQEDIGRFSKNIKVKFLDSENSKEPTVEILDRGIGQHPTDFPNTLLGLNRDYKISKFYLIGAFGQGGQTSFANCEYGIVISRKCPELLTENQKDIVGWSIVRYRDPSTEQVTYKRGLWEYCVDSITGRVLEASPNSVRFVFDHGTLIRLIRYRMPKGTTDVLQPAGSAWSALSQSLFDPILPIRLYESRGRYTKRDRTLSGLAPRLWGGGKGENVQVARNDSYEVDIGINGKIKINYWALKPVEEPEGQAKWRDIKKGFVSGNSAIFITLNGQRHGVEQASFLRDEANLAYSYDNIIVQVDCDGLSKNAKKNLISTTRERLKEGEIKELLMGEVATHLRNDRNMMAFEMERKSAILNARTQKDTSKIRDIVVRYIARNQELSELIQKQGSQKDEGKKQPRKRPDDYEPVIPPVELEVPELRSIPTFIRIANFREPIPVEKGGNALIRLETDAEDAYLEEDNFGRFRCAHQNNITRRKSVSRLRNGKISYYVNCPRSVRVGTKEILTFELELPNNSVLRASRNIVVVEPFDRKKVKGTTNLPEPNIKCVSKEDSLWNTLGYDDKSVGEVRIAGEDSAIIISIENIHLKETLAKRPLGENIIVSTKDRYSAAIAYYLLLREVEIRKQKDKKLQENGSPSSSELDRVAKMVSLLSLPAESL